MQARGARTDVHPSGAAVVDGTPSPAALRPVRARWRDPRLVVGVAVVAFCALLGARLLGDAAETVDVWAARVPLDEGQRVEPADLVHRQVRFGAQADADRYLSGDDALPDGATLARPVGRGELLPRAALGAGAADPVTEVPLSVATEAVPGTVQVGSTVDVWVTPASASDTGVRPEGRRAPRSTLVFDDVPVVAVPASGDSLGPTATRQVIVGVGRSQTSRLPTSIAALATGDVTLTVQR